MLSRVADNLYWTSRYLERAEHTARLLDVGMHLMLDQSPDAAVRRWGHLLEGLQLIPVSGGQADAPSLTRTLTFDHANPASIVSCVAAARENLRHVREQISSEMWEQLNRLYLEVAQSGSEEIWYSQPHEFFRLVKEGAHLFQGITDSTMTHGEGWYFIWLGRFLERTGATATLVDVHFRRLPHPFDQEIAEVNHLEWVGLLKSCTAFEAYCKVYTAQLSPRRIAEFLVLNPEFPHSVRFCAERIKRALGQIGEITSTAKAVAIDRLAGRLLATLSFSSIDEIIAGSLHRYLQSVREQCVHIHSEIHAVYVDYPIESMVGAAV